MSLGELFTSIRERRRRAAQQAFEEGAQITKRLQELLSVPDPREVEKFPIDASSENDTACA